MNLEVQTKVLAIMTICWFKFRIRFYVCFLYGQFVCLRLITLIKTLCLPVY